MNSPKVPTRAGEIVVMRARHGDVVPDDTLTVDVEALQSAANAVLCDGKHSGQGMSTTPLPEGDWAWDNQVFQQLPGFRP
ncbi:hypothetical protein ABZV81_29670 [Streptomyces parvus]|uniref:hypothetical protein n=1 Tax=Streptomyces parvus TaxID=66428 RepID=UPI0033A63337